MSESWTEYAVGYEDGTIVPYPRREMARHVVSLSREFEPGCRVVGRTVTASDWLPVDTDPKP